MLPWVGVDLLRGYSPIATKIKELDDFVKHIDSIRSNSVHCLNMIGFVFQRYILFLSSNTVFNKKDLVKL